MQAPFTAVLVSSDAQTLCVIDKTFEEFSIAGDVCLGASNAKKTLAERPFDLLVLDFDLPGATELMDVYLEGTLRPPAAVVALTRQGSLTKEALRQRVHFTVQKPFTPDLMAKTLKVAYGLIVKERRATFRCSVKIDAEASVIEGGEKKQLSNVVVDDISVTGLCFSVSKPLSTGTIVSLDFNLPGGGQRLHATGKIMWSDNGHAGISFESMTPRDSTLLKQWMADRCPLDLELLPKPLQMVPTGAPAARPRAH